MSAILESKPKFPGFISLLLVVALGISLAKLMWLVITPETKFDAQVQEVGSVENIQKKKIDYGKLIANQHLFGVIKKAPVVKQNTPTKVVAKPKVAPKKLNLKLYGIVAYVSREGFALISSNNGPQKVYAKGDVLEEGVLISEIFPEKVIVDNRGTKEELLLPNNKFKETTKKKHSALSFGGTPLKQKSDEPARKRSNSSKIESPDISGFRKEMRANPAKLMEIATGTPEIVSGEFKGFRLQPGRKRKFFRKLGLQPNDILTEVNGIILDSPSKSAMILGELSQAAELSITVIRKGQDVHIQHSF